MRHVVIASLLVLACREPASPHESASPRATAEPASAPAPAPPPASARAFYSITSARRPSVAQLTALGAQIFADRSLSASGALACASCHDPAHAFGPPPDRAPAARAIPSLRYLAAVPRFTEHAHDGEDDSADQGPAGGLTWDGRADSLHDQALLPLYSPLEMATTPAALAASLRRAPYFAQLTAAFGAETIAADGALVRAATLALEVYQQDPPRFAPYTSKLDAVLRGRATFTAVEARGRAIFDDPARGNCARCHPDQPLSGLPALTDFGFAALGVPGVRGATARGGMDLGLCGPYRTDFAGRSAYCGLFRTPSLRNVATRTRFMHNGVFTRLRQVLDFYATRDVTPARWPAELPARYLANLDREPPFGARRRLTDRDLADLEAYLGTFSDGYAP